MSNSKQKAKISSPTLITNLPEFERDDELLDVTNTVKRIEGESSPAFRPRNRQTKDIGAQILGSDYGKLRNKVLVNKFSFKFDSKFLQKLNI